MNQVKRYRLVIQERELCFCRREERSGDPVSARDRPSQKSISKVMLSMHWRSNTIPHQKAHSHLIEELLEHSHRPHVVHIPPLRRMADVGRVQQQRECARFVDATSTTHGTCQRELLVLHSWLTYVHSLVFFISSLLTSRERWKASLSASAAGSEMTCQSRGSFRWPARGMPCYRSRIESK